MILRLLRLPGNDLPIPKRATEYSAGIDFSACLTRDSIRNDCKERHGLLTYTIHEMAMIPLGFACDFSPDDSEQLVCPKRNLVLKLYVRSSFGKSGLVLANGTGIIDEDYRGELFACIRNLTNKPIDITHGQRIVQAILEEYEKCDVVEVDVIQNTGRGSGGFGSTGTN